MNDRGNISAVIPTLNEATMLPSTIDALRSVPQVTQVIVVDGGSDDGTVGLALAAGCEVLTAPRGRGSQLRAGAGAAAGEILWFVHADTLVPPESGSSMLLALAARPSAVGGAFRVRFSPHGSPGGNGTIAHRAFTTGARALQAAGGLYGDAALFVRRSAYDTAGGISEQPLFEDVDLVRRLRRMGSMVRLPVYVETSDRRIAGGRAVPTLALWAWLHLLYGLRVSPDILARIYAPVRGRAGRGRRPAASGKMRGNGEAS